MFFSTKCTQSEANNNFKNGAPIKKDRRTDKPSHQGSTKKKLARHQVTEKNVGHSTLCTPTNNSEPKKYGAPILVIEQNYSRRKIIKKISFCVVITFTF